MCVSEIRVKQIRVNQGLGVQHVAKTKTYFKKNIYLKSSKLRINSGIIFK